MKPLISLFVCSLFFINGICAQSTNNDFDYDQEDLRFIFSKLGFHAMKFPIKQQKEEVLDVVIEEYRGGNLISTKTAIGITNEQFKDYGIDAVGYATPKMKEGQKDSVYWHRIYAQNTDTLLTINVKTHGITVPMEFDVSDLTVANIRAVYETKEDIDKNSYLTVTGRRNLAFFYANNNPDQALFCPAGMPKENVIKSFYYAVFVSIEPYSNE